MGSLSRAFAIWVTAMWAAFLFLVHSRRNHNLPLWTRPNGIGRVRVVGEGPDRRIR